MYRDRSIALVVPAHNEEKLIGPTLQNVPAAIDRVYVVDDGSTDNQNRVIEAAAEKDGRIRLLKHSKNQGPGAAIITGYLETSREGFDIAVVVGGDHQMDLSELGNFLDPLVDGKTDYAKGNRFVVENFEETIRKMSKSRLFGNWFLTALTKIASGCFKINDVVDGYTAITKWAIDRVNWARAWKGYGYPMDFLIRLNAYGLRIADVPRTAIYLPGERQSQIKACSYMLRVVPMIIRAFFWRLRFKYVYLDFHPLVLFYYLSFVLLPLGCALGGYLVIDRLFFGGLEVTASRAVLVALILIPGLQFLLFAMLFDREETASTEKQLR